MFDDKSKLGLRSSSFKDSFVIKLISYMCKCSS